MYVEGRKIARLFVDLKFLCTAFLIDESNHMLTNHHCFLSREEADNTEVEFMAEVEGCEFANAQLAGGGNYPMYYGVNVLTYSLPLDYALITTKQNFIGYHPSRDFGWMKFEKELPPVNLPLYIPQYPDGRGKEIAVSTPDDPLPCNVMGMEPACSDSVTYQDIGYMCDTEGGSSGSPVMSLLTHKVVGKSTWNVASLPWPLAYSLLSFFNMTRL